MLRQVLLEPEIWQQSLFQWNFRENYVLDSGNGHSIHHPSIPPLVTRHRPKNLQDQFSVLVAQARLDPLARARGSLSNQGLVHTRNWRRKQTFASQES